MKTLTTSVIIPTRNRLNDLIAMLNSLKQQTVAPNELIIVDSSDVPLEKKPSFSKIFSPDEFNRTQLHYIHSAPGLTYQRNQGVQQATGDVVYFFDDDVVLQPDYVAQMNNAFANNPEFVGGMGDIHNIASKMKVRNVLFRKFFFLPVSYASGLFTISGMPTNCYGTSRFKTVTVLGGCCMAYKREVFLKHLFDEKLHGYCYMEDIDFSKRVSTTGKLFFNPYAKLLHNNSPVSRDSLVQNRAMFIHNYSYLFYKNFYPERKLRVLAHVWSIFGLFLESILVRNWLQVRGYWRGLKKYYFSN